MSYGYGGSDHSHYDYASSHHDHHGAYADSRHDHYLDYAERYHRHNDVENLIDGLREDLGHAFERIRELEEQHEADHRLLRDRIDALAGGAQ